jgi:hypothetical protein
VDHMDKETKWLICGDTHILMKLNTYHLVSEWFPTAQITLRQIYPQIPPRYYIWDLWGSDTDKFIGSYETLQEAMDVASSL